MGTRHLGLTDVRHGRPPSRLRLLAPLRYLAIRHPEKDRYDAIIPAILTVGGWALYCVLEPQPPLTGAGGLLSYVRDGMSMLVPFMVGALAAVSVGGPALNLDRRPVGADLVLAGDRLTLRQFVSYMLGYLCFIGLVTLALAIGAELLHPNFLHVFAEWDHGRAALRSAFALIFFGLLSSLAVTTLWALYFLTDIVNRKSAPEI